MLYIYTIQIFLYELYTTFCIHFFVHIDLKMVFYCFLASIRPKYLRVKSNTVNCFIHSTSKIRINVVVVVVDVIVVVVVTVSSCPC